MRRSVYHTEVYIHIFVDKFLVPFDIRVDIPLKKGYLYILIVAGQYVSHSLCSIDVSPAYQNSRTQKIKER